MTRPPALPRRTRPLLRLLRLAVAPAVVAGCAWLGRDALAALDWARAWEALGRIGPGRWAVAALATLAAFLAVARQERLIAEGLRIAPARGPGAAMAAAGLAQALGCGPLVGALARRRLRPEITLPQSLAISAGLAVAFLTGLGGLAALAHGLSEAAGRMGTDGLVGLVLAALAALGMVLGTFGRRRRPRRVIALAGWVAVDAMALGLAFWALLPPEAGAGPAEALPAFLVALGAGLLSGSPAGAGPFEAVLALHLTGTAPEDLAAAAIAFRVVSYAVPAALGAAWVLVGPRLAGAAPLGLAPRPMAAR